jgi:hypothetical protein
MHDHFEDLLLLYMTRSIDAEQLAELRLHLAECSQCRASINEWRAIAFAVKAKSLENEYALSQEKSMEVSHPYHYTKHKFSVATALTVIMILLVVGLLTFFNRSPMQTLQTPLLTATSISFSNVETVDLVFAARPIENGAVIHAEDVIRRRDSLSFPYFNGSSKRTVKRGRRHWTHRPNQHRLW